MDETFVVDFVSRVGSYEQGVEALVRAHARLAAEFDRTSRAGDRVERQMLGLAGAERTAAAAGQQVAKSVDAVSSASPRLRYALYDVASTATIAGAAILGLSVVTAATAIRFQRDFANIARVTDLTGPALQSLRDDFDALYRSIPVSFADLAEIGTLAGQLDIADSSLASFTETVAKFSATSNVSVEASATALGRLAQLLPDVGEDYEGLADSILKVGANSVSTEAQIIAIASQLAGVATTANLTSEELIALAGTLASVGTAPELSRGAITRLFSNIETSIAAGGDRLEAFATVSGRTSAQFREDWGNDSFAVLQDLFSGIGESGGDMGAVLRSLGITASRDIPVFQKLAQNTELLASAFGDASNAAGEVDRQYSIISSTTAEKIQVLINNFTSLLDVLGRGVAGFGLLVDVGIGLLQILQRIAENPVASTIATFVIVAGALLGVTLLLVGGLTRLAASSLAVRLAMQELNITSASSVLSLSALTTTLGGTTVGATRAAGAVSLLSKSLKAASIAGIAFLGLELGTNAGKGFYEWLQTARGVRTELDRVLAGTEDIAAQFNNIDIFRLGGGPGRTDLGQLALFAPEDREAATNWNQALRDTYANIQAADEALTRWVNSGDFEKATAGFNAIAASEQGQLLTTEQLMSLLPNYSAALQATGSATSGAASETRDLVAELADTIGLFTDVARATLDTQNSIYSLGQSLGENGRSFDEFSAAGRENMAALLDTINAVAAETPGDAATTAANLQALFDALVDGAGVSAGQLLFLQNIIATLAQQGGGIGVATANFNGLFQGITVGSNKAAKAAGGAARAVRTLVDYASDLAKVVDRAFDIRFGSQAALDQVTTSWIDLNEQMAEYQRTVQRLTADRAIKAYFLEVAEAYNDTLRAGVLRSEIADIDAELADATAGASTELKGNSKAAIENRKRITDLLAGYGDYIEALAASGASQETINAAIAKSRAEFLAQAQALGFSTAQLQPYIRSFDDMAIAVSRVPRNITVAANVNPALQALNELEAAAKRAGGAIGGIGSVTPNNAGLRKYARGLAILAAIEAATAITSNRNEPASRRILYADRAAALSALYNSGNYYDGGYTGPGGKYEPKGVVHGGEFVFTKQAVNNAGVGRLYAMMRAFETGKGYAMGGYVPVPTPVSSGGYSVDPQMHTMMRTLIGAVKEIRPGWILPEEVSRVAQIGNDRRRAAGDI